MQQEKGLDKLISKMEDFAKKVMVGFLEDVEVDKELLKQKPKDRFLWMVCHLSTYLIFLDDEYFQEKFIALKNNRETYLEEKKGFLFLCDPSCAKMKPVNFKNVTKYI